MDSGHDDAEPRSRFSVPVSRVVLGAAALAVLGAGFLGGVAFEKQRSEADLATVSSLRDAVTKDSSDRSSATPAEPVELEIDETVEVDGPHGGLMVTLNAVGLTEGYSEGRSQRSIELTVTLGNLTGTRTRLATLDGNFEDNLGQRREHVTSTCFEDPPLPSQPVPAGRFIRGCESMTIPDDAGCIVLDHVTPELYVEVPAA